MNNRDSFLAVDGQRGERSRSGRMWYTGAIYHKDSFLAVNGVGEDELFHPFTYSKLFKA
jgi:hypothetical protein